MNPFDRIDDDDEEPVPPLAAPEPMDVARGLIGIVLAIAVAIIVGALIIQGASPK